MKRLHVMVQVRDLEASKSFYSTLFDAEPTVTEDDYAKWMLEDPLVNFSIAVRERGERLGVEHLGIQAETPEELQQLRRRIELARTRPDVTVHDEGETVCCHHRSDKTWVTDAQGVAWEAFYTHGRATPADDADACCDSACCGDDDRATASIVS